MFINIPSVLVVLGGGMAVTLMKFPVSHMLRAFKIALKAFLHKPENPTSLMEQGIQLANIARKDGILGLEQVEVQNEFLAKGIQLVVDGQAPEVIQKILAKDINLTIERHDQGKKIFLVMP